MGIMVARGVNGNIIAYLSQLLFMGLDKVAKVCYTIP